VLEHARAGQRALLRDVPDQDDGDAACLGEARHAIGHLAHLADRAGRAAQLRGVQRLHRVDHAGLRALRVERRQHGLEVGLGQHRHVERAARQPLGAQAHLGRGLLAGDVEHAPAGGDEVAERHARERRLADARRAAEQHDRARHEPAAEHAIELPQAGPQARQLGRPQVREPDGLRRTRTGASAPATAPPGCGRPRLLDERVPGAAARALPVPADALVPAGRAGEDGRRTWHLMVTLGRRADELAPLGIAWRS
jgi:hypothetical protein